LAELSIARSSDGVEDALDAFMSDESEINYDVLAKESPGLANAVRQTNDALTRYLDEEFADPDAFVNVPVDFSGITTFGRLVLEELRTVKAGELITYGALAQSVGSPHSARAVGGAVGANPMLIAVPCHRVVAADGSLGGFSAGLGVKRWLLAHEGVAARPGGWEARRRPVS
jgi:methylated-DNA-[protein]-cysteine S-methyltransferase